MENRIKEQPLDQCSRTEVATVMWPNQLRCCSRGPCLPAIQLALQTRHGVQCLCRHLAPATSVGAVIYAIGDLNFCRVLVPTSDCSSTLARHRAGITRESDLFSERVETTRWTAIHYAANRPWSMLWVPKNGKSPSAKFNRVGYLAKTNQRPVWPAELLVREMFLLEMDQIIPWRDLCTK